MPGAAVVEDDRRRRVSSPPTTKFHIIQPVVVNQKRRSSRLQVDVEVQLLQRARGGSRRARARSPSGARSCPSCRAPRAGGRRRPARTRAPRRRPRSRNVVPAPSPSRSPSERGLRVEVAEDDRPLEASASPPAAPHDVEPVVVAPAVAVAVDGEQDARLDLREPVDDAPRAEVRRAARPDRAEARARVERDDGLDDVGEVRDDPVARPDSRRAERARRSGASRPRARPRSSRASGRSSDACRTATVSGSRSRKTCSA